MLAAQQRRQRLLQSGMTPPSFRISAKRGPTDKATPGTNATPTPTPGLKHMKSSEDSEMLRSSKKSLFNDIDADGEEKSSRSYLPAIYYMQCTHPRIRAKLKCSAVYRYLRLGLYGNPWRNLSRQETHKSRNTLDNIPSCLLGSRNGSGVDILGAEIRNDSPLARSRNFD